MKSFLATYLHDHMAGATFAVELLVALGEHHHDDPVGQMAKDLLVEIEEDRDVLKRLAERVDGDSHSLKDAVSWIAEKASRLKLRRQTAKPLGTFESVEALGLGILGKEALWKALAVVADEYPTLRELDFEELIQRARAQHAKVEVQRLRLAQAVFVADVGV